MGEIGPIPSLLPDQEGRIDEAAQEADNPDDFRRGVIIGLNHATEVLLYNLHDCPEGEAMPKYQPGTDDYECETCGETLAPTE